MQISYIGFIISSYIIDIMLGSLYRRGYGYLFPPSIDRYIILDYDQETNEIVEYMSDVEPILGEERPSNFDIIKDKAIIIASNTTNALSRVLYAVGIRAAEAVAVLYFDYYYHSNLRRLEYRQSSYNEPRYNLNNIPSRLPRRSRVELIDSSSPSLPSHTINDDFIEHKKITSNDRSIAEESKQVKSHFHHLQLVNSDSSCDEGDEGDEGDDESLIQSTPTRFIFSDRDLITQDNYNENNENSWLIEYSSDKELSQTNINHSTHSISTINSKNRTFSEIFKEKVDMLDLDE